MAFFSHMLVDAVDIEPNTGVNIDRSLSYGAPVTGVPARVERDIQIDWMSDGSSEDTATVVWLERQINEGDRITLPGGEVMEVAATQSMSTTDGRVTLHKAAG